MADENQQPQTPRIGVVGQPSQPQGQPGQPQPAQQPQRGVPGTQQPPVPSAEQVQRVMAEQARQRQADAAEAQRRATELAKTAQPGQAVHGMELPQSQAPGIPPAQQQIPADVAAQMPPQMQSQTMAPQDPPPSPVPGMTAQEVLAGPPQPQSQPQPQQPVQQPPSQQQSGNQFAQYAAPVPVVKASVPWYPIRSNGVDVELEDSIIKFVPQNGIEGEGNAQAKVILALFSEILALREKVAQMSQAPAVDQQLAQRVYNLERVLHEQRQGMQARARGIQEQIAMFQAKGLSPDQIVAALSTQSQTAAAMVDTGESETAPAPAPAPEDQS